MADYLTTDTELTSIANAIRTKGETSASLIYPSGFISAIEAIQTGPNAISADGVYFGELSIITFMVSLDGLAPKTYTAIEGMTFSEWASSDYNVDGLVYGTTLWSNVSTVTLNGVKIGGAMSSYYPLMSADPEIISGAGYMKVDV